MRLQGGEAELQVGARRFPPLFLVSTEFRSLLDVYCVWLQGGFFCREGCMGVAAFPIRQPAATPLCSACTIT